MVLQSALPGRILHCSSGPGLHSSIRLATEEARVGVGTWELEGGTFSRLHLAPSAQHPAQDARRSSSKAPVLFKTQSAPHLMRSPSQHPGCFTNAHGRHSRPFFTPSLRIPSRSPPQKPVTMATIDSAVCSAAALCPSATT